MREIEKDRKEDEEESQYREGAWRASVYVRKMEKRGGLVTANAPKLSAQVCSGEVVLCYTVVVSILVLVVSYT